VSRHSRAHENLPESKLFSLWPDRLCAGHPMPAMQVGFKNDRSFE
jgi:hypothetical protein